MTTYTAGQIVVARRVVAVGQEHTRLIRLVLDSTAKGTVVPEDWSAQWADVKRRSWTARLAARFVFGARVDDLSDAELADICTHDVLAGDR